MHRPNAPSRNPHQVNPRGIIYAVTYATPPEPYAFKDYNGQIVMQPPQPVAGQRHPYSQVPAWNNAPAPWDYSYKNAYGHPMPQQQAVAPPAPQRKVLDIIDPTTGEKVDLTKVGVSSKNEDTTKEQIRAQFASKVAAVATPRKSESEEKQCGVESTHENGVAVEEERDVVEVTEVLKDLKVEEPVPVPKKENKKAEAEVKVQEQLMRKEQILPKVVPVQTARVFTPEPAKETEEVEQTLDDNKGDNSDSEWKETKRNKKKKKAAKVEQPPPQNLPKGNNSNLNRQQKQVVNGVSSQVPSQVTVQDQPQKEVPKEVVAQPRAAPAPVKQAPVWPIIKSNLTYQPKTPLPAQVPQQKPAQKPPQPPTNKPQVGKPQQQTNPPPVNVKPPPAPAKQPVIANKVENEPKAAAAPKRKSKEKSRNKREVPKAKTPEPTKVSEEVVPESVAVPEKVVSEPVVAPVEVAAPVEVVAQPTEVPVSKDHFECAEEIIPETTNLACETEESVKVEETASVVEVEEEVKEVVEIQETVILPVESEIQAVAPEQVSTNETVEEKSEVNVVKSQDVAEVEEVVTKKEEVDEKKDLKPADEEDVDLEDGEIVDDDDDDIREDNAQMTKFNYSEDQWSPLNPEGSKKYNRDFLIQIQQSVTLNRPTLPDLDIVLREPHLRHVQGILGQSSAAGPSNDFANYVRQNSNHGYASRSQNRGQHRGPYDQGRKIIEYKMFDNVTLHKTEDAWQKHRQQDQDETTRLFNSIRGVLNKLTPQQFDVLMEQVKTLNIDSESKLAGCISLLFEQCVKQPIFSGLYARMGKCFSMLTVPSAEDPTKNVTFRKLLLTKCQQEFEQDKENEKQILALSEKIDATESGEEKKRLEEQKSEAMTNAKRRSLGNIRFIGELYKLAMLTENIMHECLHKLLRGYEDEDNIECLCKLLTTIGKDIDNPKNKFHAKVEAYFSEMKRLVDEKKATTRIRFMMMDVIDLRQGGWMQKRNEGPKTIEQIHKEVEKEKMETARRMEDHGGRNMRRQTSRHSSNLVPSANTINEDGWTNVSRTVKTQMFDASKIKLTRMDDNIQLGAARNSWNKGSTGGMAKDQNLMAPTNRYSLLSNSVEEPRHNSSGSREQEKYAGRHSGYAPYRQDRPLSSDRSNERQQQTPVESKAPLPVVQKPDVAIPREDMEKKVKSRVEEYLMVKDMKEAIETVKELNTESCFENAVMFFYLSIEQNIEKSSKIREEIGLLHLKVLKVGAAPVEAYAVALKKLTRYADDIAVDIPQFWKYVGEAVSPIFLEGSQFKLDVLIPAESAAVETDAEPESEDCTARLFAEVLNAISQKKGHHQATELWEASSLKWEDLVKSQPVADFLKRFKVDYTVGSTDVARKRSRLISVNENKNELITLFSKPDATVEEIHDWIFENMHIPSHSIGNPADLKPVSDCCTALCMSCLHKRSDSALNEYDLDEERMKKFLCVIKTLTFDKQPRQLEVLFGLQELFHRLSYPKDLLHRLFELLFDAEVLNETAFHQWREDTTRTVGKGVAISSVSRFYNWIVEEEKDLYEEI